MVAVIDEMRRAPSSGVRYSFSTEVLTSFRSRSATCHFGSIFGPNSFGFIEANCWTRDAVTVGAILGPPLGVDNGYLDRLPKDRRVSNRIDRNFRLFRL